ITGEWMGIWQWIKRRLGGAENDAAEKPAFKAKAPSPTTTPLSAPARRPSQVVRTGASQTPAKERAQHPQAPHSRRELPPEFLQFSSTPSGTVTDIVVGFDFGTSCAKVAMQTPYALGARTVVIDFGPLGHESCAYLLPAAVHRDGTDRWHLTRPEGS